MNNIRTAQSPLALAAAITLAVAGVTALTMPTPTPVPTAEQSGDTATTPGLQLTPAAYSNFCTLVGSVPGDPEPDNCRRIPTTVLVDTSTTAEVTR